MIAARVLVAGRVQGVAFRWHTRAEAAARGLAGWVRNLDDGRVEVHVEGPPAGVQELCAWLASGPPAARVTSVERAPAAPTGRVGFAILR